MSQEIKQKIFKSQTQDKGGGIYLELAVPLEQNLFMYYSTRHRAILVVEKDLRDYEKKLYPDDKIMEVIINGKEVQFGIVQEIPFEYLEIFGKAHLAIKKIGLDTPQNLKEIVVKNKKRTETEEKIKARIAKATIDESENEEEEENDEEDNENIKHVQPKENQQPVQPSLFG